MTPQERAFVRAQRILQELREMGESQASFTLYSDASGSLTLSRNPGPLVQEFAEYYLKSARWERDAEGHAVLTTCHGLLEE